MALEVTWSVYQQIIVAYQHPKKAEGKKLMKKVISTLRSSTMPKGLEGIKQLGNTLYRRQKDVLAYFDIGASNGPVEAMNGRLEHLRGIALGFKNGLNAAMRKVLPDFNRGRSCRSPRCKLDRYFQCSRSCQADEAEPVARE